MRHWLSISQFHIALLLAPGPDATLVVSSSLRLSGRQGAKNALGITLGTSVFAAIAIVFFTFALKMGEHVILAGKVMAILVVLALTVLAIKKLRTELKSWSKDAPRKPKSIDDRHPVLTGFIAEIANVEMVIFMMALFSAIKNPGLIEMIIAASVVVGMTAGYYYGLSQITGLASRLFKKKRLIEVTLTVSILAYLGIKYLRSSQ